MIRNAPAWIVIALAFADNVARAVRVPVSIDEAVTFQWYLGPALQGYTGALFRYEANNHPLNTLLEFASVSVFGLGDIPLRIPALIGGGLYLAFGMLLCRRMFGPGLLTAALTAVLWANPLIRDFSIAARGYGLALGLLMVNLHLVAGLLASRSPRPRARIAFGVALALMVLANFVFAVPGLVLGAVVAVHELRAGSGFARAAARVAKEIALPALALFGLVAAPFLRNAQPTDFFVGYATLDETLWDLIGGAFWRDATAAVGLFARHASPTAAVIAGGVPAAFVNATSAAAALLVTSLVFGAVAAWRRGGLRADLVPAIVIGGTLPVLVLLRWAGVPYPVARTGIWLVPIATLGVAIAVHRLVAARWRPQLARGAVAVGAGLLTVAYVVQVDGEWLHPWKYDAGDRAAFAALERLAEPGRQPRIGSTWILAPSLEFQRSTASSGLPPIASEADPRPHDHDFFVINAGDLPFVDTSHMRIVHDELGTVILQRDTW